MRPVTLEDEIARLGPVLPEVLRLGLPVSIDTIKAKVAAYALDLGAQIVNDVWGLQRDPDMARVVAERGCPVIVMHNRETVDPALDIMTEVNGFFARSLDIAGRAGIARESIVLDPGVGFGKTPEQSITVIARLAEFRAFGLPLLMGLSRKRFIESVSPAKPSQRLGGSIAGNVMAVLAGADIVRVHDVAETVQALRVMAAIEKAR
jgi:dihydropteroate synthase